MLTYSRRFRGAPSCAMSNATTAANPALEVHEHKLIRRQNGRLKMGMHLSLRSKK
jgi:hypothetical protein